MPSPRDLTGERFGKLTAVEPTDRRESRYTVWKCRCDCGNEVFVSTKKLQRGSVQSCGCDGAAARRKGAPPEDITGKRYGRLTAVRRMPSVKGKTMWLCSCDCGNEIVVEKQALKTGRIKSCGCVKDPVHRMTFKDITGRRFGRLTAMHPTERRDSNGSVYWRCKCDCGNETEVTQDCLTNGNTVSCGCKRQEHQKNVRQALTFVEGTCVDYLRKRKSRSDNKSGYRGVYRIGDRYRVTIGFKNKRYYLGTYQNFEKAVMVRREAEKELHEQFVELYDWWQMRAAESESWKDEHPLSFDVELKDGEIHVSTPLLAEMKKEKDEQIITEKGGYTDAERNQSGSSDTEEDWTSAVSVHTGVRAYACQAGARGTGAGRIDSI